MRQTKSKLNLVDLQTQFDELLESFNSDQVVVWKQSDMILQGEMLFKGQTIEVESNPVSFQPISCDMTDLVYRKPNEHIYYENAA